MSSSVPAGLWLNVGSGPEVHEGWLSIDGSWQAWLAAHPAAAALAAVVAGRQVGHWPRGILCRDVRTGLGVADNSAAVIYSSHFIEHLTRDEAVTFLEECRRALTPNGICRIVTPDLRALAGRYLRQPPSEAADRFMASTLLVPAEPAPRAWLRWYRSRTAFETHKWLYDATSLSVAMSSVAFRDVRPCEYLQSSIPSDRLRLVERRERIADGEGVVVEAVK